jgi:hypothetical protein
MITILEEKKTEFTPYKSILLLFNTEHDVWRVVGVKEKEMNTIIHEGKSKTEAEWVYRTIIESEYK